jgi:hypothetical protein
MTTNAPAQGLVRRPRQRATHRRRTHIPYFDGSRQVGHLDWRDGAMEAYTADGTLVGKYPTRREAAAALWATIKGHDGTLMRFKTRCQD